MSESNSRDLKSGLFCFALSAASMVVVVMGVSTFFDALAVESWPTAEATIVRSRLESSSVNRRYGALIAYKFEVNGKTFHSSSVRTRGVSSKHRSDVAAVVERFPADSVCPVYYNADDPEVSYLEAGVDTVNYILIGAPMVFAILMVAAGIGLVSSGGNPTTVDEQVEDD